jgi:hypothetical protein
MDPSAQHGRTREQELFVGASKQDTLTKFRVSGVKGNRRRPVLSETEMGFLLRA